MDTRGKTNAEFRAKITETLGRHDANFDELNHNFNRVNDALQGVMAELQAMRITHSHRSSEREVNPFAGGSTSHDRSSATFNADRNHTTLKLNFSTYSEKGRIPLAGYLRQNNTLSSKTLTLHDKYNWRHFICRVSPCSGIVGIRKARDNYAGMSLSQPFSTVLDQLSMMIRQKHCPDLSKPRL